MDTTAPNIIINQTLSVTAGRRYRVTADYVVTAGSIRFGVAGTVYTHSRFVTAGSGTIDYTFVAATSSDVFGISSENSGTIPYQATIDNISVKEIPGHHAIAPSDSALPKHLSLIHI